MGKRRKGIREGERTRGHACCFLGLNGRWRCVVRRWLAALEMGGAGVRGYLVAFVVAFRFRVGDCATPRSCRSRMGGLMVGAVYGLVPLSGMRYTARRSWCGVQLWLCICISSR